MWVDTENEAGGRRNNSNRDGGHTMRTTPTVTENIRVGTQTSPNKKGLTMMLGCKVIFSND